MLSTQEMLRLLASAAKGTDLEDKHLSVQDLVSALASCVDVDEEGFYLRVSSDGTVPDDDRRTEEEGGSTTEPVKEIYQMVENQVWNSHSRIWAQNVTVDDRVPDEYSLFSDYLALPLSENRSGVIYNYLIHYDDSVLYYDPANSGLNTDSEGRIFKDRDEFLASDETKGIIYLKVSIFDEPGFLAKWYVTKDHWVVEDPDQYEVLRTYTKLN